MSMMRFGHTEANGTSFARRTAATSDMRGDKRRTEKGDAHRMPFPQGTDGSERSRRPTGHWHVFPRTRRRGRSRTLPYAFSTDTAARTEPRPPIRLFNGYGGADGAAPSHTPFPRTRRRGRCRALPYAFPTDTAARTEPRPPAAFQSSPK
jgi:hypothetical protein